MTFRNDVDAANARIESLEREKRELEEQNERLNVRLRAAGRAPAVASMEMVYEPKPWPLASTWLTSLIGGIATLVRGLFSRR